MTNIMMEASDMWDLYQETPEAVIGVMHEVASNSDYGVKIYFTAEKETSKFVVEVDDEPEYEEFIINDVDCQKTFAQLCENYLTSKVLKTLGLEPAEDDECGGDEYLDEEEIISNREDELDLLIEDFILNVTDGASFDSGNMEVVEDLKEHFLEYMAREHSIPVYRPMRLVDEDSGEEFFEEYPYECMVFDEEPT